MAASTSAIVAPSAPAENSIEHSTPVARRAKRPRYVPEISLSSMGRLQGSGAVLLGQCIQEVHRLQAFAGRAERAEPAVVELHDRAGPVDVRERAIDDEPEGGI